MIKLGKNKLSVQKITSLAYVVLGLFIVCVIYFLIFFLYKNLYLSITKSEVILVLNKEVASEVVDINKFNQIIEKLNQKSIGHKVKLDSNPFK